MSKPLKTRISRIVPVNSPESFAICREIREENRRRGIEISKGKIKNPLTKKQIIEILDSNEGQKVLGAKYGVSKNVIGKIKQHRHVYYMSLVGIPVNYA